MSNKSSSDLDFMLYHHMQLEENIKAYAQYMIDENCSIRRLEKEFWVPRTTMHKYLTCDLKYIDDDLFVQCKNIMKSNRKNQKRDCRGRFI